MADTFKPWVWAVFAFNSLFATIFALLAWYTFSEFKRVSSEATVLVVDRDDWVALFRGAAVSAFFALLLVIIFVVVSIYYMVFTRVSLAHPRSRYGKGFLVAASFYTAMHLANIAAQFWSFTSAMHTWTTVYHADFDRALLIATYAWGFISAGSFLIFAVMLMIWPNTEVEALEHERLSTAA
ncbi:hypothetical protein WJX72_003888 [[Myrmecia] bisecta]|uniref:Uncharacterized protein n=1 Tax=[Myrmecia] bisecta TaxID=41462 RepID=A0AAW1Q197_9CHLO